MYLIRSILWLTLFTEIYQFQIIVFSLYNFKFQLQIFNFNIIGLLSAINYNKLIQDVEMKCKKIYGLLFLYNCFISIYHKIVVIMNLRSKISEPQVCQSQSLYQANTKIIQRQTGNLRQMMKQNYDSYDQQMIPSSVSQSHLVTYNNPPQNISKGNSQQFNHFFPPVSHIQSESSIQVPDVQALQRTTPRRRRIFDHDQNFHQNFRKKSNPNIVKNPIFQNKQIFSVAQQIVAQNKNQNNLLINGGSIRNTPSFGGESSLMKQKMQNRVNQFRQVTDVNQRNSRKDEQSVDYDFLSHDQGAKPRKQNLMSLNSEANSNIVSKSQNNSNINMKVNTSLEAKPYFRESQAGQPSFHTLPSVKKVQDEKKNSSVYETPNANFNEPFSILQRAISQRNRQSNLNMSGQLSSNLIPALYNETQNVNNQNFGYPNSGGVKLKNPFLDGDRQINKFTNENHQYHETESQKNQYRQNQILKQSGTSRRKQIIEGQANKLKNLGYKPPVPVYENQFYKNPSQSSNLPYQQYRTNEYQPYYSDSLNQNKNQPFNTKMDNIQNSSYKNRMEPENRTKVTNNHQFFDILISDMGKNQPINPDFQKIKNDNTQMLFENFPKPHPLQHRQGMRIDPTQPILEESVDQKKFMEKTRKQSMSPFEQTEKQKIKYIPKRFDLIEDKVNKQEIQLERLNKKIVETHAEDLNSQKKLLNQLIKKQQELSYKQKEINNNLQQMKKLHQQNLGKKQQLIKYQLELQQSKRIEELYKQNERLYQQLIKKQSMNKLSNTSFNQINFNFQRGTPISPQLRQAFSSQDLLLSPFALNPNLY